MTAAVNDAHEGVDAWIFLSVADTHGQRSEYTDPLATLLSNADWRNHAVPTEADFEHAVRDLTAAGLIRADGQRLELTDSGELLWKRAQEKGNTSNPQFIYVREQMKNVPCVASSGGWSLERRRWEDAFAMYSPQFALDLKRRKAIAAGGSRLPPALELEALAALRSPQRAAFLATLAYSIGFAARGNYPTESNAQSSSEALRSFNELIIVIAAQLARATGDPGLGYPEEAFITALNEKGATVMDAVVWALSRSLKLSTEAVQ